jgi:hypothetical protein
MEQFVMPTLDSCVTTNDLLNLWMSNGHNTFGLVINFINSQWVPYYVTIGLFKATDTSRVAMVMQVKCRSRTISSSYNLLDKLIVHVKDENGNLSTLA